MSRRDPDRGAYLAILIGAGLVGLLIWGGALLVLFWAGRAILGAF